MRLAIVVAEVEFCKIAVQMVLAAVLIDALHSTLEDREEAFDGVGVDGGINLRDVFALSMASEGMPGEVLSDVFVLPGLVGHDPRLAGDILLKDRNQSLGLEVIDDHAARLSAGAVYQ